MSSRCWTSLRRCVESVYVVLEILSVLSEVCCVRQVLDFSSAVCGECLGCAGDIERVV